MSKLLVTLLSFTLLFAFSSKSAEIAAIDHDGRYITIDLDSYQITNVGDLKRFGFLYVYNAITGSTFESAIIEAKIAMAPSSSDGSHLQHSWIKLSRLNEKHWDIPKGHIIAHSEGNLRWIANDEENRMAFMAHNSQGSLSIYNSNLRAIEHYSIELPRKMNHLANCKDNNNNITIASWQHKVTYPQENSKDNLKSQKLGGTENDDFFLAGTQDGCFALMTSTVNKSKPHILKRRVIDISSNRAQKVFTTRRKADLKLYDNGQHLLVHHSNDTLVESNPSIKTSYSDNFIIYNTQTGEIIKEFKIPNQNATLKKVVKTDRGYLAILGGPQNIQFVSLETFKSLKTIKLPFKRFFVI